ncbi:MAG: C-terminal helicase domain-containing protein, partial [Nanoarchaeota archaeon]
IDEIESVKSPRDKKIFAKDALVLAHKSTLHNPLVQVPISVLTPNPLADKVEDICMVATLCDRDKYPTVNHARSALNEGGIQKAFYILREKGTPLAEDIGEKIPPKLKYIIPIMPSKNIYLINRYILRNRRRIPNWLTQVRHLYSNPNLVDERLVVNVLGEYKFQLDDMRKTLALIDILTHTSPYVNPLERGEKCVIFSPYFRDGILTHGEQDTPLVLELLQSAIKSRYGDSQQVVPIHGNIDDYRDIHSIGEREKLFHLLANSPKHNVGFITSEVGGVSKDLSAANNIFVYDPPIAVYVENQLEGRGWRTGQKLPVNIYTLLMQDPLYDRSRIHDLDDTVDIESCFVVPYLNARFLATSPRATMSVDEATFALVRAKDIILRYGFHGVLPDESLVDLLEGKKQRLMLPTREEDFTLSRREQELIATGGISFAHRSIEDALGNSPDHYFITAGVPLPEDRPVFEPQSSGIKPQETIVSAVLIDPTGQELKIIDTTSTAVLPIKHTAKKPTKRKKAAEAPIELKHILPEPEIIVLPTEVRPLKESESRELVPVQPTYGQLSPRSLADMSRQQIYDAVTAVFGGARTPEEFLRRRILDLDKFMQGLPKYEDINALARHIYKQRGGNILSDDLQNIVYKAMDRLNIKRSNTEIRRLYNAAKVASYYKQMGYHDITWAALERVYRSTPKAIKINAFSRACMDWGEDSSNLRKLPDPPEMFAEGQHPVHEMLLTLAAPYIDVIHTHTVKIIETFRDSVTYGKQTRGHRLISGLKYLPNL